MKNCPSVDLNVSLHGRLLWTSGMYQESLEWRAVVVTLLKSILCSKGRFLCVCVTPNKIDRMNGWLLSQSRYLSWCPKERFHWSMMLTKINRTQGVVVVTEFTSVPCPKKCLWCVTSDRLKMRSLFLSLYLASCPKGFFLVSKCSFCVRIFSFFFHPSFHISLWFQFFDCICGSDGII